MFPRGPRPALDRQQRHRATHSGLPNSRKHRLPQGDSHRSSVDKLPGPGHLKVAVDARFPRLASPPQDRFVRCEECGAEADEHARGWRAMLGLEDDDTVVTVVLCPECAEREFGPSRGSAWPP